MKKFNFVFIGFLVLLIGGCNMIDRMSLDDWLGIDRTNPYETESGLSEVNFSTNGMRLDTSPLFSSKIFDYTIKIPDNSSSLVFNVRTLSEGAKTEWAYSTNPDSTTDNFQPIITGTDGGISIASFDGAKLKIRSVSKDGSNVSLYSFTIEKVIIINFDCGEVDIHPNPQKIIIDNPGDPIGQLPTNPVKTGEIFKGWYSSYNGVGDLITEDTTFDYSRSVYAWWERIQYTITYSANGADTGTVPSNVTYYHGDSVYITNNPGSLVKSGYVFNCWNTKEDGTGVNVYFNNNIYSATTQNKNFTLYAKWELASNDNNLTGFVFNNGFNYDTTFNMNNTDYTATANSTISTVSVKPAASDPNAIITVSMNDMNSQIVQSGTFSQDYSLLDPTGENILKIEVRATNGAIKTYKVTITKTVRVRIINGSPTYGTVIPILDQEYQVGHQINLCASPNTGYGFDRWEGPVVYPNLATTPLNVPPNDVNITGFFIIQ